MNEDEYTDEYKEALAAWLGDAINRKVALNIVAAAKALFKDDEQGYNKLYRRLKLVGEPTAALLPSRLPSKDHPQYASILEASKWAAADLTQAALMVIMTLATLTPADPEDLLTSVELRLIDRPAPPEREAS
jgi:hypothetical protein